MLTRLFVSVLLVAGVPVHAQAPAVALKLHFYNVKVEWTGKDGEELPTWVNGTFSLDAAGKPVGRVVEVALSDDGNDDDGDPAGFDTWVFDSADGSLSELTVAAGGVSFSAHDPSDPSWSLHLAARCNDTVAGTWVLQALSQSSDDRSVGKNRFPLASQTKDGELQVFPDAGPEDPDAGIAL
jgi:hypothetical protein